VAVNFFFFSPAAAYF